MLSEDVKPTLACNFVNALHVDSIDELLSQGLGEYFQNTGYKL